MKYKLYKLIKDFFSNNSPIVSGTTLCLYDGVISHLLYSILFFYTGFTILGIHSVLATTLFSIFIILYKKIELRKILIMVNFELLTFVLLTSYVFDWRFSFHLYIFVIIPISILSGASISSKKYNLKLSIIQFIIMTIGLIGSKVLSAIQPCDVYKNLSPKAFNLFDIVSVYTLGNSLIAAFILLFAFIIDLNKLQDELEYASTHDPLTNLINRGGMNKNFDLAITEFENKNSIFSIILADIDNFKHVNDTYGHSAGDIVLKDISKIITNAVNDNGYVCRWGGEEILILSQKPISFSINLAEAIRKTIEKTQINTSNAIINITATFGVAEISSSITITELINKADDNLYKGKTSTKNCVIS